MSESSIKASLNSVLTKIEQANKRKILDIQSISPRLVAVAKTHPYDVILEAYEAGQRHFGENYVQELVEKATNQEILEKCKDIKWHFIGRLQSNKINKVLSIPKLFMIETVHSKKLATLLNQKWPEYGPLNTKLKVMLQVNTSGEEAKSGVPPNEIVDLMQFVKSSCHNLEAEGIMTIGCYDYNPEDGPNPDFLRLRKCREEISTELGIEWKDISLSMGMTSDYEQAVELGSTNVRVGTAIFGPRRYDISLLT